MDERELRNRIKNKMIRPTTIPQTLEELVFEQAVAREALRLAYVQHKAFATALKGVQQQRTIGDTFRQETAGQTLVDNMKLDLLVASGGVLSHAPRMAQTAMMLIDAFEPEGFTTLAKDSIFMMPHLGVLAAGAPAGGDRGVRARLPDLSRDVRRGQRPGQGRATLFPLHLPYACGRTVRRDEGRGPATVATLGWTDGDHDGGAREGL